MTNPNPNPTVAQTSVALMVCRDMRHEEEEKEEEDIMFLCVWPS